MRHKLENTENDINANVNLNEGNPNVEMHRTDPTVDLKEIERKVWMRCHQDGLMDIFLGLMLLLMGSGFIFVDVYGMDPAGALVAMSVMGAVAMAAFYSAKRLITYPRIGRVEFSPKGKSRQKKTAIVFSASLIVGVDLGGSEVLPGGGALRPAPPSHHRLQRDGRNPHRLPLLRHTGNRHRPHGDRHNDPLPAALPPAPGGILR